MLYETKYFGFNDMFKIMGVAWEHMCKYWNLDELTKHEPKKLLKSIFPEVTGHLVTNWSKKISSPKIDISLQVLGSNVENR